MTTTQPQVFTSAGARAMDKATAATAAAEVERVRLEVGRERALLAQQIRREETQTRAVEQEQRKRERAAKAQERKAAKAEARLERQERRTERLAAIDARRALMLTLVVIGASVTIAWPGQAIFLAGHGMAGFGLVAPIVIEGPQWLAAVLEGEATRNQGRVWQYRAATFFFSGIAATLNYLHGVETSRLVGDVFALSSLVGVVVWEMYVHSQRQAHSKRSAADRKQAMMRRLSYPFIYRRAVRLSRATGMDIQEAWPMAWREVHGADVGITADGLTQQNKAMAGVAKAYNGRSVVTLPGAQIQAARLAESAAAWAREAATPAATRVATEATNKSTTVVANGQVSPAIPPVLPRARKASRLPLSAGARKAAATTASRAQQAPEVVAQDRLAAARMYLAAQGSAEPLSLAEVGAKFGKSGEWARLALVKHPHGN